MEKQALPFKSFFLNTDSNILWMRFITYCANSIVETVFPCFYYAPAMTMAGILSVTPIKCYPCLSICHPQSCPLSNSNIFYQNFMKLGHVVLFYNVFFKFDNGPYGTMLSGVTTLCS